MRFKLTILLVLLNAALFLLIYFLEKKPVNPPLGLGTILPEGVVEATDKLQISGRDMSEDWIIEKENGVWQIISPVNWQANLFAVNRIFNQLQFLEKVTSFPVSEINRAGQSLEDYGLDPEGAILTLFHNGNQTNIGIGKTTEIGNRLYILSPDRKVVHVVNRHLLDSITVDLDTLRSQEIFDIPLFEVRSLNLKIEDLPVRITRDGEGWSFETPIEVPADTTRVEMAINNLTGIRLIGFSSEETGPQGLENPTMRLTLEGNNRRQTILVGNALEGESLTPQYFAKLENKPTTFTLPAQPFEDFFAAQERLRERNFVQLAPESLTSLEIFVGESTTQLQKLEQGAWQVTARDTNGSVITWPADTKLTMEIIDALLNLRAVRFVTDSPSATDLVDFGLNDPQRRIILHAGEEEKTILMGDPDLDRRRIYVKIAEAPFVYQIEENEVLTLLQSRPLHYRRRDLVEQPHAARILSIELVNLTDDSVLISVNNPGGEEEGRESEGEGISAAIETLPEADREAAEELFRQMRKFTVKSYLKDQFTDGYDLGEKTLPWKYLLKSTLHLPGGAEDQIRQLNFYFTERLGGTTQIGGSPEYSAIFELDQKLIDAIFHFTFEREQPEVDDTDRAPDSEMENNSEPDNLPPAEFSQASE